MSFDPLTALLGDASALFPVGSSTDSSGAPPILRDRGVGSVTSSGTPPSKMFSVVKLDRSTPGLCFGMIGVGSAFCFKIDCKVKSHMEHKIALTAQESEVVVIQRPSPFTAFREPIIAAGRLSDGVWRDWEKKTMGLLDWSKEFQAVDCAVDGMASFEDVKEATEFIDKADLFRTPSKRKMDPKDAGPFGEDWEFIHHERMLPTDAYDLDQTIKTGVTKEFLTKTLATVETSIVEAGSALEEVAKVTLERFVSNEKDSMLMAGAIQSLKGNLGAPTVIDDKFGSPTLWGTTAIIVDEVNKMGESIENLEAEMIPFKASVTELLQAHDPEEAKAKADKFLEVLTMVMTRMKQLSPEFEAVKLSVANLVKENARGRRGWISSRQD
ncbi:hypothetical protein MHU86_9034 [Fragilaria crotonensis]|nr:hypothetical protein MHU86_9034 [Fragilaria crotonensis]